jgi:membrane-associated phospholipid phosphatase
VVTDRIDTRWFPSGALMASALLFVLACFIDAWVFHNVVRANMYASDLGRFLRIAGFLPTWLMGAAALVLYDRGHPAARLGGDPWRRGLLLAGSPILGGLLAEVLKLVIRRERPMPHGGAYVFRDFVDQTWSTGNLGLPSSHVLVAFSGAAMASYLFPRTAPVWMLWAAGCAATRVLARAHFLSDALLGAIMGALVARTLVVALARRDRLRLADAQPISTSP